MDNNYSIREEIDAFYSKLTSGKSHRYQSWEHCFGFFRRTTPSAIASQRHHAAQHLGFYLASWGMYRGSSFLLQYDYTAHLSMIDCLSESRWLPLWAKDVGTAADDVELAPLVLESIKAVRQAYNPLGKVTDTLVTKILLGTIGCLPACDRYFIAGFRNASFKFSSVNREFVERVLQFCRENDFDLRTEQARIKGISGLHYPMMKLVDMYFWQIGYELLGE